MSTEIELHIEHLVIEGGYQHDGPAISLAIQQELTRLLTQHGPPPGLSREQVVAAIDGGHISIAGRPATTGQQIAGAVFRGIGSAQQHHHPTNTIG
jgi:hypothetical protein